MRFPGSVNPKTYEEYVVLYLNCERVRALLVADTVTAFRIANGDEKFPREWKKLLDGED